MGFSRAHQADYRPLVKKAWALHCERSGFDESDAKLRDEWTRDELEKATGKRSTKDCNGGRHPERACAHFELLADDGYKHQVRLIQGDLKRIKYAVKQISPDYLKQFAGDDDFRDHLETLLRPMFGERKPPELHELNDGQIDWLTQAARIDAQAYKKRRVKPLDPALTNPPAD